MSLFSKLTQSLAPVGQAIYAVVYFSDLCSCVLICSIFKNMEVFFVFSEKIHSVIDSAAEIVLWGNLINSSGKQL